MAPRTIEDNMTSGQIGINEQTGRGYETSHTRSFNPQYHRTQP